MPERRSGTPDGWRDETHRLGVMVDLCGAVGRRCGLGQDFSELERGETRSGSEGWGRAFASLSAACWAYMLGCSDTLSRLVACGREERAQERLGRATSLS